MKMTIISLNDQQVEFLRIHFSNEIQNDYSATSRAIMKQLLEKLQNNDN